MRDLLRLVWRYLAFHRLRTAILITCVALVLFLPLAVNLLVGHFEEALAARAESVPLLVGAKGSRYDLLIQSLYFRGRILEDLTWSEQELLEESDLGLAVPLFTRHTARGHPLIGTTIDYFEVRGLRPERGTLPLVLGDCVLGSGVAADVGLAPGDHLLTDPQKLYDLASSYPLRMLVTGVLETTGGPDDYVIFADVKTTWIAEGIGHGHMDVVNEAGDGDVLERGPDNVAATDALMKYMEVTPANISTFHFHGERGIFPLSAILVWPHDPRASTILKGRYRVSKTAQLLVPTVVVGELLGFVFRIKSFFDANSIVVGLVALLFLVLIVALGLKIRAREMETFRKIGCDRWVMVKLQALEMALVCFAGLALAGLLGAAALAAVVYGRLFL